MIEKLVTKNMNMFLMFAKNLKWKRWNIITTCIYKCDVLLLADVFENLEIIAKRIMDYVQVIFWAHQV